MMLFETALTHFITAKKAAGLSPITTRNYEMFIASLPFAGRPVGTITRFEIDAAVGVWRAKHRAGEWSKSTVQVYIASMKVFFNWCKEYEMIPASPAAHIKRHDTAAKGAVMSEEDYRAMLKYASRNPRDKAIFCFMADTGVRAGELVSVTLDGLDLEGCTAIVNGKSGAGLVDFTYATSLIIREWLEERPEVDNGFLFVGRNRPHNPLKTGALYSLFAYYAKKAGVKGAHNPHSLRNLVGQRFTDMGNLELARQKLRHSKVEITAKYYANQDRSRLISATEAFSLIDKVERPQTMTIDELMKIIMGELEKRSG